MKWAIIGEFAQTRVGKIDLTVGLFIEIYINYCSETPDNLTEV
jgi:hypothetical protein